MVFSMPSTRMRRPMTSGSPPSTCAPVAVRHDRDAVGLVRRLGLRERPADDGPRRASRRTRARRARPARARSLRSRRRWPRRRGGSQRSRTRGCGRGARSSWSAIRRRSARRPSGSVLNTFTSRSLSGNGSGRSSTASTTAKIARLAPRQMASVASAVAVNAGRLAHQAKRVADVLPRARRRRAGLVPLGSRA